MAISTLPFSTLLALPGRQPGHVQLISLPPCPPLPSTSTTIKPTSYRSPIILAHTHALSSLTCSSDGLYTITTSERGTLLRVWDTLRGHLVQELRRGVDRAEMWGASFQPPTPPQPSSAGSTDHTRAKRISSVGSAVGWSDKGTIHIWSPPTRASGSTQHTPSPSITNILSKTLPLPKYFSSTASVAQYHLPRKNPHAFTNVVSAAAGKAGVHTRDPEDEDDELSERFVVTWIPVPADQPSASSRKESSASGGSTGPAAGRGSTQMGSREERRSFGSDATSRTATPTFRPNTYAPHSADRSETPTMSRRQSSISSASAFSRGRSTSGSARPPSRRTTMTDPAGTAVEKGSRERREGGVEWQLVAITFSGDWYRLRLPDSSSTEEEKDGGEKKKSHKCELVEYRRLGVGGGGW